MDRESLLLERLKRYGQSEKYPFHMPGHKRQCKEFLGEFPNPFSIDITEIEGFDNLHHPEGILKESMEWAARIYGANKSYYLINGSSGGVLSAICGVLHPGEKIIMARNCHKSAYHAVILNNLKTVSIYPQIVEKMWINGEISANNVEKLLSDHPDAKAVMVVSPTYEGIVSNIQEIAKIVHEKGIPLIVDEAHGAHFSVEGLGKVQEEKRIFPVSSIQCGADIVIQSLHKTLPSFTQTGIMHVKKDYVDLERLEWYLQVFQSSSPSYVWMAGIEKCIFEMEEHGKEYFKEFGKRLKRLRRSLKKMKCLRLLDKSGGMEKGIYDLDVSKIVISCRDSLIGGAELGTWLRDEYNLEMEMCGVDYVVAITTFMDTQEGLDRLEHALLEIDRKIEQNGKMKASGWDMEKEIWCDHDPLSVMTFGEAMEREWERMRISDCEGRISVEFVYLYPPGIPIVAPGERITREIVKQIDYCRQMGLLVQGMADEKGEYLRVCKG